MEKSRLKSIVVALAALIGTFGVWNHFAVKTSGPNRQTALSSIPPLARLEPSLISILFLGEPRLYQAFLGRWTESIFTSANLTAESANQLFSDYDVIARHEPKSEWFYIGPCLTFSERLQRPDLCFSITGYGQRSMPTSWRIPLVQAFIEGRRLNNSERSRFFLEIAAKKPNAPIEISNSLLQPNNELEKLSVEQLIRLIGPDGLERYQIKFSTNG